MNEEKYQVEAGKRGGHFGKKKGEIESSRQFAILGMKLKVLGIEGEFSSSLLVCLKERGPWSVKSITWVVLKRRICFPS